MGQTHTLSAQTRNESGTRSARRMRSAGKIPGILYGHGETPVALAIDQVEFQTALRHGLHGLLSLQVDGKEESVVIKELQYDHLGIDVFHVDFARVSAGEQITVRVPVQMKGTPEGTKSGGVLEQPVHEIELECPASNVLEKIVVNVSELQLDGTVTIADLQLPEGVTAVGDPDMILFHLIVPTALSEEAEPGEASATEPELIRKEKEDDASED